MKSIVTGIVMLLAIPAIAQKDTSASLCAPALNIKHSIVVTASAGFIDHYRHNYTVPSNFEKSNTSGYALFYAKVEYGLTDHLGVSAIFGIDDFVYNFNQLYSGYNGTIRRYRANRFRFYNAGLAANYHFQPLAAIPRLHPFIPAGFTLNNLRQSGYPQGDSTVIWTDHTVSPFLKAGARYYVSNQFSVYADAGYDELSIFSIGASFRFSRKKEGASSSLPAKTVK